MRTDLFDPFAPENTLKFFHDTHRLWLSWPWSSWVATDRIRYLQLKLRRVVSPVRRSRYQRQLAYAQRLRFAARCRES